jgi:hypothetical protein
MQNFATNPFADSANAENVQPDDFVHLFSPTILTTVQSLFRPGNVVLKGAPGIGKSMLLTLLKPETQIAYAKSPNMFPIPTSVARYVGAGINLARTGAQDIGNRLSSNCSQEEKNKLSLIFGDFLNYYLTKDLLKTVQRIVSVNLSSLRELTGVTEDASKHLTKLAMAIADAACWNGALTKVNSLEELLDQLEVRLRSYRSYFNFNSEHLPDAIQTSITSVGEPIAMTAECLKRTGVVEDSAHIFVRIDQLEELYYLEKRHELGNLFRQVVNKALAMRDPRISYRIGVRGFAWEEELTVFGSGALLEEDRDFSVVDLDSLLKRTENSKNWIFKELAEDVFYRRLQANRYDVGPSSAKIIQQVLDKGLPPDELAKIYAGRSPERILDLDLNWPLPWREYLIKQCYVNPLATKFAEAWCRQRGKADVMYDVPKVDVSAETLPWMLAKKKYWRKERSHLALMQIAGRTQSRLIWAGVDDIIGLSGGNALCFITICRHIWQAWLRSPESRDASQAKLPSISWNIQATGVYDASRSWFEKSIPHSHNGDTRRRLVQALGIWFGQTLSSDKAMSNPGSNGFSLTVDDLNSDQELRATLAFSADFGDLSQGPHTSKMKDRKPRTKFYLAPILCPYFRIPHIHTKEPIYTNKETVRKIFQDAEVIVQNGRRKKNEDVFQRGLFDEEKL